MTKTTNSYMNNLAIRERGLTTNLICKLTGSNKLRKRQIRVYLFL